MLVLYYLYESLNNKRDKNFYLIIEIYNSLINKVKKIKNVNTKEVVQYRLPKRYTILSKGFEKKLHHNYLPEKNPYFVILNEQINVINNSYIAIGHSGRTRMIKKKRFSGIS